MIDAIALHRPATLSRIGLAAALAISLAAVAAATPQAAFAQGTLTWAVPSDVTGTDPQNNGQTVSKNILSLVYEQLMTLGDGVNPSPLLAESYEMESPTRYVFTLRDGVSFTNGRALSVNDVVKSFERILDPDTASPLRGRLLMVDTIEALDAHRIAFNLKTPYAGFLASVADSNAMIMPMDEFAAGTFDPTRELIGTGPFMVSAHSRTRHGPWCATRTTGRPACPSWTRSIFVSSATRAPCWRACATARWTSPISTAPRW